VIDHAASQRDEHVSDVGYGTATARYSQSDKELV